MNNNEKISSLQLALLTAMTIIPFGLYSLPSLVIDNAKNDAWIVKLLCYVTGLLIILLYIGLANRFGELNFYQFIEKVCGKLIGKAIVLIIVLNFIYNAGILLFIFSRIIIVYILPQTPLLFIYITFIAVVVYALFLGIENIARANDIIFPITIVIFMIGVILLTQKVDVENLKPVLADGIIPLIYPTYLSLNYTVICTFAILTIPPQKIIDRFNYNKAFFIGYSLGTFEIFIIEILVLTVIGSDLATYYLFPAYELVRKIGIEGIIDRVEILFFFHWIAVIFFYITFLLYGAIEGIKTSILAKDNFKKWIILSVAIITIYVAANTFKNNNELRIFLEGPGLIMHTLVCITIPLILYIISLIRKIKG